MTIKRRLVSGILLLVMALFDLFMFFGYYTAYSIDGRMVNAALMAKYLLFGVLAIVVGVIYIVTCKRRPIKWQEMTLQVVAILLMLFTYSSVLAGNPDYKFSTWLFLAQMLLQAIGAPGKNGFKGYPYATKDQGHDSQSIEKLTKLKELLDSGAITQEEFDQEKKKIWK